MVNRDELTVAVRQLVDSSTVELMSWAVHPARSSTGRATAQVEHVTGTARVPGEREPRPWRLVLKTLRASSDGEVAPAHWTYWQREALAYESGLLPHDEQGLCAVPCFGVFAEGGAITLALGRFPDDRCERWDVERYVVAARRLGRWQRRWRGERPSPPWLAADQLAQRIARTDGAGGLDRAHFSVPLRDAWERRWFVLRDLAAISPVLTHGDFSRGNLSFGPDGRLFVIDWATLGLSPPGFDLAHLVLSAMVDRGLAVPPATIADALLDAYGPAPAFLGSVLLTGISRLCWMRQRTRDPAVLACWNRIGDWLETLEP